LRTNAFVATGAAAGAAAPVDVAGAAFGTVICGKRNAGTAKACSECTRGGGVRTNAFASGAALTNSRLQEPAATNARAMTPRRNAIRPKVFGCGPNAVKLETVMASPSLSQPLSPLATQAGFTEGFNRR
jgi:hypothetical protein